MAGTPSEMDLSGIEAYLTGELDFAVGDIIVLHDGINLTLEIQRTDGGRSHILRRPNSVRHSSLFNELSQEYAVMNRLQETSIRTPEPVLYCDDASIIGDSFFAMTALDGESVRLGERLPERFRHPPARERVGKELIDTLAELHALPLDDFDDICNTRSLQEEIALASDRLDAAAESMGGELPRHRAVGDWLRENAPTESPISVCHGDYRPSNVLFSGEDMPALSGVLDWETAFLGDPFTELGYLFLRWRDPDDASPSLQTLEERFPDHDAIPELRRVNECGLSPFTGMPGSPPRRKLVSRYENRTGLSFDREGFYVALSAFALGSVWADIHRECLESGEPSDREPWIDYMALVAERAIDDSTAG